MKKIYLSILAGVSLFLAACFNQAPSNSPETPNTPAPQTWQSMSNPEEPWTPDTQPQDMSQTTWDTAQATTWNQQVASWDLELTDCSRNENASVKKTVLIKLADIKDSAKYEKARKQAVDLINECYNVTIQEEYEETPWVIRTQEWSFERKIADTDEVFDKLMFYPMVNVYDFDGFMWTQNVKYITNSSRDDIIDFYKNAQVDWYKSTPSDDENKLLWTDIATTQKVLELKITPKWKDNILEFSLTEPLVQ